jgi:hypothetical protein
VGAKRPRAELIKLLAEQREALAASCESYDRGNEWEAARLATTVFTLVHDGGSISSLLTQLGLRGSLRFVSSGRDVSDAHVVAASPPLVIFEMNMGKGARCIPLLDHGAPSKVLSVQFPTWWAKEVIYKDHPNGVELTRKRLIFALRHQDGGGHVGALTDQAYVRFKAGGGWFGGSRGGPPGPMITAATATMRQVAWEISKTLEQLGEVT